MKGLSLFEILSTFLTEATSLLGWPRLILAVGVLVLIGAGVVWILSKVLCREESHAGAAIGSCLSLLFVAAILGVIHLAATLSTLTSPDKGTSSALVLQAGIGIAAILVLTAVHGAFGTKWWKAVILTVFLLGSTGAAGLGAIPHFFAQEKGQLTLLANQCAGATTEEPWLIKSEAANKKIKIRRAHREREELLARQSAMFQVYADLQQLRQKLHPKDQAGITAFNKRAADYTRETQSLRTDLTRVEALIAEGDKE